MSFLECVVFGVTLFLALAVLLNWKRRRDRNVRRVNRGLRGYVCAKQSVPPDQSRLLCKEF